MGRATTRGSTTPDLLADERLTTLGLLAETFVGLAARLEDDLAPHGVGGVEFEVLIRLARSPGRRLRMSDLTAQTALTSSGVTRLVDRLEKAGLVARQACSDDRRIVWTTLTDAGADLLERALPGHLAVVDRWLTGALEPAELAAFSATLRRLRDSVHPAALAGTPGWSGCSGEAGERTYEGRAGAAVPDQAGSRSRR
jgi:MarR family 2-MHQ and catechol resistance regulon transcriptional repressor